MKMLGLLAMCLTPLPAVALDMDFYTYNGFDETVAAFTRLALIFSDNQFLVFFTIFAVVGVIFGALAMGVKGVMGEGANPIAVFIPIAIGLAICKGLLLPTGNVHVYDPVRGAHTVVADVPDLVVLLAGGLNKIERGMVSIIDTASADPYSETGGAMNYSLVRAANKGDLNNYYVEQSIINYYMDCGLPALGQGTGGERQKLLHNTDDPMTEFAKWQNAAIFTTYHPDGSDAGEVRTCQDAWSGSDGLFERLETEKATTFGAYTESVCKQAGFNPSDAMQMTRCREELEKTTALFGNPTASSEIPLIRAMVLGKAVSSALNSADFSQTQRMLVDRQVMAEGFGTAQAMDQWVPKVRAFMLAVALGIVPIAALFIVTPLLKPSLMLLVGLFAWLATWGICDAVAVQMAADAASDGFDQIRRQGLGIEAILHSPEAAVQALGVFGKSRMVAITLATVLSGALFKFSGYAVAQLGQQWQSHLEQAGEQAGRQTMLPEEQAALQRSMVGAGGFQGAMATQGFGRMAGGMGMGDIQSATTAGYVTEDLSRTMASYAVMSTAPGVDRAIGSYQGQDEASARMGMTRTDFAQGAARFSEGEAGTQSVTRSSVAEDIYGDKYAPGEQSGRYSVATDAAVADKMAAFAGGQDYHPNTLARETARNIDHANEIGAARAYAGGDGRIDAAELSSRREDAFTQETRSLGEDGSGLGRSDSRFAVPQSTATNEAWDRYGAEAHYSAAQNEAGNRAGRGIYSAQAGDGDAMQYGADTARMQTAGEFARFLADSNLGNELGLNTGDFGDYVSFQMMKEGQVQLYFSPEYLAENVDKLPLNDMQREMVEQGGMPLAATVNFDPATGSMSFGRFTDATNLESGNFTSVRDGIERVQQDTSTQLYGERIDLGQAAVSLGDDASRTNVLMDLMGGDIMSGQYWDGRDAVVAGAYTERLQQETGISGVASHLVSTSTATDAGLSFGTPAGNLGPSVGTSMRNDTNDNSQVSQDAVLDRFKGDMGRNLEETRAQVIEEFGPVDSWNDETTAKANQLAAGLWATRNELDYRAVSGELSADTAAASDSMTRSDEDGPIQSFLEKIGVPGMR